MDVSFKPQKAKLFANGRSQAVRLPAEFRFKGKEVYIRRDLETGDVILSTRSNTWDRFEAALKAIHDDPNFHELSDFMDDRPTEPAPERDWF